MSVPLSGSLQLSLASNAGRRAAADTIVSQGAGILDRIKSGWETQIKPRRLNIASAPHCILGQLYGGYSNGLETLRRAGVLEPASSLGFAYGATLVDAITSDELTAAWRRLIRARLGMCKQPVAPKAAIAA